MNILTIAVALSATGTSLLHTYNVVTLTQERPRYKSLVGLIPIAQWWLVIFCVFGFTDFAWIHTGLVTVLIAPLYCLIVCR